jgi:hypothetical protein
MGGQQQRRGRSEGGSGVGPFLEGCATLGALGGLYAALKHVANHFLPKPCPHISTHIPLQAADKALNHCLSNTVVATAMPYLVDAAIGAMAGVMVGICLVMLARILQLRRRSR